LKTLAIPDAKCPVVTWVATAHLVVLRSEIALPLRCEEHTFGKYGDPEGVFISVSTKKIILS
jgi:hypothetical protein